MRRALAILALCAASAEPSSEHKADDKPPSSLEDELAAASRHLKKGFFSKAYTILQQLHATLDERAYSHRELQEYLCICATKLRKEAEAITACANTTVLTPPSAKRHVLLVMAQGEARLYADDPEVAHDLFSEAEALARKGDALRHEKEAREAQQRARRHIERRSGFVSFGAYSATISGQSIRVADHPGSSAYVRLPLVEHLRQCMQLDGCTGIQAPQYAESGQNPIHFVRNAKIKEGSAQHTSLVRDEECRYVGQPGILKDEHYSKSRFDELELPPGRRTIQEAYHMCDWHASANLIWKPCAGIIVEGEPPFDPKQEYMTRFRVYAKPGFRLDPASKTFTTAKAGHYSFGRTPDRTVAIPQQPSREQARENARREAERSAWREQQSKEQFKRDAERRQQREDAARRAQEEQRRQNQRNRQHQQQGHHRHGGGHGGHYRGGGSRGGPPPNQRSRQQARDYYGILKVRRDASPRQIKKAYHAMAKKWHPDKNRKPGMEARAAKAERNFKLVARAYEVLSDEQTRHAFNRGENVDDPRWKPGQGPSGFGGGPGGGGWYRP